MAGASQHILEVILRARDELSSKVNDVNNKMKSLGTTSKSAMDQTRNATQQASNSLKQQESSISAVSNKYNSLRNSISNTFNNIKNTISNATKVNINTENLSVPFKNAAEKIRNVWQTAMQHITSNKAKPSADTSQLTNAQRSVENLKQKINSINSTRATPRFDLTQINTADGKIKLIVKDLQALRNYPVTINASGGGAGLNQLSNILDKVQQRAQKLNNTNISPKVSNAGLATLNGQITTTTTKVTGLGSAITRLGTIAPNLGLKLSTSIASFSTRLQGARDKIGTLTSSMSMLSSSIMGAFGAVGVSSLSQFTIGAAIARQKVNAVTTSITGSVAATNQLNKAITSATSGGVVGFNNVAKAVQTIGIKHNLTNAQLERTPPLLNKIGTLAMAMGKDSETAANLMSRAYDGLNGNFMLLQRNFGITKQQLLDAGWSGAASDVDGYTDALQKVLDKKPEMQEYLNSYEGQMQRLQLAIQGVGREIGEVFLPVLNWLLGTFLEIHKSCPWLTTALVIMALAFVGVASAGMILLPVIELLTIQIGETTIGMALLNAVMDANPIMILVIAIIALIAILAYLYSTSETVRNILDGLANTIMGILTTAWENLQRIIAPLYPTFEHLGQTLMHLWHVLTGTSEEADQTGGSFDWLGAIIKLLALYVEYMVRMFVIGFETIVAVVVPIIDLIANVLSAIINLVTKIIEAFGLLAEGDVLGFLTTLGEALATFLLEMVTYLGQFVIEVLNNLGVVFIGASAQLGTWLFEFIQQGINAGIQFITGFFMYIWSLPGRLWTYLWQSIINTINWGISIVSYARQYAINFVTAWSNYIMTLPSRIWTWLVQTANKIIQFGSTAVQNMRDAAIRMVNALKEKVSQLPQVMWDELMRIGDRIRNAAGELVAAIIQLGKNLLHNFKHALGIESPGFMYDAIAGEMNYIGGAMSNAQSTLADEAESVGASILGGFNNVDMSAMETTLNSAMPATLTPVTTVNPVMNTNPATQTGTGTNPQAPEENMFNSETIANTELLTTSFMEMSALVNPELLLLTQNINNMALASNTTTTTAMLNNQQVIASYNAMQLAISSSMTNIQNRNIQGWNNIKQVTLANLNSILSSTKSVTSQMVSAWQKMKDSIIKAAEDIKTESSSRFDRLWSTIKTFYHNIQHPGGAGSPAGAGPRRNTTKTGGFKAFANIVRSSATPNKVSKQVFINNGLKRQDLDYFYNNNSTVSKRDLLTYVNAMEGGLNAGWGDVVAPNVKWIRDTTNEWETAPPVIINKYNTSQGFRVGDFENGTPNITFDYFRRMAEDVFSQCHYEFYWNSERYGHWIPAFHNGGMNCDDSTEALMAMARACGLSATKVHGHWNQYGHYWANIAGHKMDTTGWMNRRTWTPSASHAGSPTGEMPVENSDTPVIIELLNRIIELLTPEPRETPNNIVLTKENTGTVKIQHDFKNLPESTNENQLYAMMKDLANDKEFLKALTSNDDFQYLDNKYKNKILGEIARFS